MIIGISVPTYALKNGAEFKRPLEEWKSWKINVILVKSIIRFAQDTVDCLNTAREVIAECFEREIINSLPADGELILTFLTIFG